MNFRLLMSSGFTLLSVLALQAQATSAIATNREITMKHAHGPFDIKLEPLEPYNRDEHAMLSRMAIEKQFHGDLEAASRGEMLSTGSPGGSGGYVAIERVTGALHGRRGSFALQHNATMTRGTPYLNVVVVPGSGTGELQGLSGTMNIIITDGGAHTYNFEYSLDE